MVSMIGLLSANAQVEGCTLPIGEKVIRQDGFVAELLRDARKRLKYSQDDVAVALGISTPMWIDVEDGHIRTRQHDTAAFLNKVAKVLQLTLGEKNSLFEAYGLSTEQIEGHVPEDLDTYQVLIDWIPEPALVHDRRSNIMCVNAPFARFFYELRVGDNFIHEMLHNEAVRARLIDRAERWDRPTLRVMKSMAAKLRTPEALAFFRGIEEETGIRVPIGQHSIMGEIRPILDPEGNQVWVEFISVRPTPEGGSDMLIQIFRVHT